MISQRNTAEHTLLIFDLNGMHFAVDAKQVREIIWLPELTPVEETAPHVAGLFSMREQLVPVIDLNLYFSHPASAYTTSDQIVVLERDRHLTGIIVSEVLDVIAIDEYETFDCGLQNSECGTFDIVPVGEQLVTLLDASQLMYWPQACEEGEAKQMSPVRHFCPEATPEQHALFHSRAISLMDVIVEVESSPLALAVLELGGEYFGIELGSIQEFCDYSRPAWIPCCPPHILGAISLRGNLYTLLDIRGALNLPHSALEYGKAVILHASFTTPHSLDIVQESVAVAVDAVHNVVYLKRQDLQFASETLRQQYGTELTGAAHYDGHMMAVLDLPALLARSEWIVNETA